MIILPLISWIVRNSVLPSPFHIPIFFARAPTLVSSSVEHDSEDENPTLPTHPPEVASIEREPTPTP